MWPAPRLPRALSPDLLVGATGSEANRGGAHGQRSDEAGDHLGARFRERAAGTLRRGRSCRLRTRARKFPLAAPQPRRPGNARLGRSGGGDAAGAAVDAERHQRALVEDGWVGCVLHDMERDFDRLDAERTGVLRLALGPEIMLTARHHPLRSADIAKAHILLDGVRIDGGAAALDLIITAIIENIAAVSRDHAAQVETFEDALLERPEGFDHRRLIGIRRRVVQFHRLLSGMRAAFRRLEQDRDLPPELLPTIEELAQQLGGIDEDMLSINGQLRLLREEADLQATQRTNQNLYVLSILSALLLPATLVTGFFGMNTGGLPFAHSTAGTFLALGLATLASLGVYALLRRLGLHKT